MKKIFSVFILGLLLVGCSSNKTETTTTIKGDLLTNILDEKNLKNGATNSDFVTEQNKNSDIKLSGNFEDNSKGDNKCLLQKIWIYYIDNGYYQIGRDGEVGNRLYKNMDGKCQEVIKNSDDTSQDHFSSVGFATINNTSYVGSYEGVKKDGEDKYTLFRVYELDGLTPKLVYDFGNIYKEPLEFDHFEQYGDTLFLVGAKDKIQYINVKTKISGTISVDSKILKDNIISDLYVYDEKLYLTTTKDNDKFIVAEMYEFNIKDVIEKEVISNPTYTYKDGEMGKVFENYIFKFKNNELYSYSNICMNKNSDECLRINDNEKYEVKVANSLDSYYLKVTLVNKETKVYSYYIYNIEDKSTYKLYDRQATLNTYDAQVFDQAKGQFVYPNIIENEFFAQKYNNATLTDLYSGTDETPAYLKLNLK